MSNLVRSLFLLSFLLTFAGCSSGIPGSGVAKTESRAVAPFKSVSHDTVGKVVINIGEEQSVSVTLDDNLIDFVETDVTDGELHIKMTESFSTQLGLTVQITTPSIEALAVKGVGSTELNEIDSESLAIKISGVGSVTATGKVKNLNAVLSGVGNAKLEGLKSESTVVKVSGVGNARVHASQSIDASTSGVGSITVFGNPQDKKTNATGIGKITIEE